MRFLTWLAAISLLALAAGCGRTPTPVANMAASAASTPVGPVPGEIEKVNYPTNPLAGDPVALQDGRRLFNWYNCSGCHGGHAGGGMGPSLRDPVGSTGVATTRFTVQSPKGGPKACLRGARKFLRSRFGNWWPTSSRWGRCKSQIRPPSPQTRWCPIRRRTRCSESVCRLPFRRCPRRNDSPLP